MVIDLEHKVNELYNKPSDINEHIPTLIKYGQECDHITEMGVRWIVSTWAFLGSSPKKLISYDKHHPKVHGADINLVYETAERYGLNFEFIEADTLEIEIEPTDLLFIDTYHSYKQLKEELNIHSNKARKYIILHDTVTFGEIGQDEIKGLRHAIEEFLEEYKIEWKIKEEFTNNNGLTILERIK